MDGQRGALRMAVKTCAVALAASASALLVAAALETKVSYPLAIATALLAALALSIALATWPWRRPQRAVALAEREHLMRALRAGRMISWECDLASRRVTHTVPVEIFGSVPPSLALRAALRLVHREDRREVLGRARATLERREPSIQHFRVVLTRGASPMWMENHSEIVCDASGRALRLCGSMLDITAHKHALEALSAADRRKDEFIATLAHELRSPLSAIATAAQILRTTTLEGSQVSACVDMIRRQTHHLGRLVDDLLDVSRAIRDRLEFRRERVELCGVLRSALETLADFVSARHHEVELLLPPEPVEIEADPVRLAQVFENLLTNAAKYTPHGGRLRVTLETEREWAVARVSDSGIGIAPEELERVFEPFYQVNASLARARGGLGIGLALVKRIVQLHGGSIEAMSAGLGCGSEFAVRLPIARDRAHLPLPISDTPGDASLGSGRARRILIADDNADVAEAMALGLRMCGHEVAVALDGEEALRVAEELRPQVALLDLGMPKRPGHEVALELRQRPWAREQSPFLVALTGWAAQDLEGRVDMSAFDFQMMKPTEIDAVNQLVARAPSHANHGGT